MITVGEIQSLRKRLALAEAVCHGVEAYALDWDNMPILSDAHTACRASIDALANCKHPNTSDSGECLDCGQDVGEA